MIWSVLLALAAPAEVDDDASIALRDRIESAPQEIASFIERRATCGDIRRDPGRDVALATKLSAQFRCDTVERDGETLKCAYRKRSEILALLKDTESIPGW